MLGEGCIRTSLLLLLVIAHVFHTHASVIIVGVGMYFRNLGEYDMKMGLFYTDFNLYYMRANQTFSDAAEASLHAYAAEDSLECNPNLHLTPYTPHNDAYNYFGLDLVNLGQSTRSLIQKIYDRNGNFRYIRIKGQFMFSTDLRNWPLDTQVFDVVIEQQTRNSPTLQMVYCHMPAYSGLSPEIRMPGFAVHPPITWTYSIYLHCMPPFIAPMCNKTDIGGSGSLEPIVSCGCNGGSNCKQSTCDALRPLFPHVNVEGSSACTCRGGQLINTRYMFSIIWERPMRNAVIRVYLPPIFITLLIISTYFLPVDALTSRISVCGSAVVATVMFHSGLEANTPAQSGFLLSDVFLLMVYISEVAALIVSILMLALKESKRPAAAREVFKYARAFGVICTPALFSFAVFNLEDRWFLPVIFMPASIIAASTLRWYEKYRKRRKQARLERERKLSFTPDSPSSSRVELRQHLLDPRDTS